MHTLLAACAEPGNQSKPPIFLTYAGARSLPDPSRTHGVPNAADYAHTQPISKSALHTQGLSSFLPLPHFPFFTIALLLPFYFFLSVPSFFFFLSFILHLLWVHFTRSFPYFGLSYSIQCSPSLYRVLLLYTWFSYFSQGSPTLSRVILLYPGNSNSIWGSPILY